MHAVFEPEKWKYRLVPIWYRRLMTVEQCRLLHNLEQRRARSDRRFRKVRRESHSKIQGCKYWTEVMTEIGRCCQEYRLTVTETALVACLAVGMTQKEAAAALSISMRRLRRLLHGIRDAVSVEDGRGTFL